MNLSNSENHFKSQFSTSLTKKIWHSQTAKPVQTQATPTHTCTLPAWSDPSFFHFVFRPVSL